MFILEILTGRSEICSSYKYQIGMLRVLWWYGIVYVSLCVLYTFILSHDNPSLKNLQISFFSTAAPFFTYIDYIFSVYFSFFPLYPFKISMSGEEMFLCIFWAAKKRDLLRAQIWVKYRYKKASEPQFTISTNFLNIA